MIINFDKRGGGGSPALTSSAFTGVEYVSSGNVIYFYNLNGDEVGSVDTSDFVIDGMIEDVTLSGTTLIIDFNTASGIEDIEIDLTEFINPEAYYTSAQTDTLIASAKTEVYASANTYTDTAISGVNTHISEVEDVTSEALVDLNSRIVALSGATSGMSQKLDISVFESSDLAVSQAINDLESRKVASNDVRDIVKMSQSDYNSLSAKSATTLYIII